MCAMGAIPFEPTPHACRWNLSAGHEVQSQGCDPEAASGLCFLRDCGQVDDYVDDDDACSRSSDEAVDLESLDALSEVQGQGVHLDDECELRR